MPEEHKNLKGKRSGSGPFLKIWVPILVALIGCIGSVSAAIAGTEPFATVLGDILNLPGTSAPVPTLEPFFASGYNMTQVPTVSLEKLPCTFYQTCAPGEDWLEECINSQWAIYPSTKQAINGLGCYQEPIWGTISTQNGGLLLFAQPKALISAKDYGLFAPLPQSGRVKTIVDLDVINNGQVWFGIFAQPNVNSEGLLLVAPPGDVRRQAFAVKDMPSAETIAISKIFENSYGVYSLEFGLENGPVTAFAEGIPLATLPFSSPNRWLFVGYRAKLEIQNGSADIQAAFLKLEITPK